ncbi:hypothetical protein [Qipengyuania sp.]|uniref:hypothetical protein n=1 Tax=Qipengyuania sp. TaxID=2004515 RepID=UPI0035C79F25
MTAPLSRRMSEALIANYAFFAALPEEARERLKTGMAELGQDVLEAQQQSAPVYSGPERKGVVPGLLKSELTVAEAFANLRVRIGFPQLRGKRSKIWYAIVMEYGRQAREVPMRRLKNGARSEWRSRIGAGTARAGLKPDDLLTARRTMRVGAIEPRPFVHQEERFYAVADAKLAELVDGLTGEAVA